MLEVYHEKEENPYPKLCLVEEGGCTYLQAVDNAGNSIANLIVFRKGGEVRASVGALSAIRYRDFKTDFAEWDEGDGKIIVK